MLDATRGSPRQGERLSPGTLLADRYRLESILGAGAFGVVWRARHVHLETECAVKLFDPPPEADPQEASGRFLQEARLMARLKSPHVAQVFDYGVHERMPFLVLELLRGRSLARHLQGLREQGQRLPPREAARILQHVAEALSVAHAERVVHRDLKPDNIFLVEEEERYVAKVLDFGIAKWSTDASPSMTTTRVVMGTAHYMSPEQFESARQVDHRADLWSLGVIAFECLTGQLPFPGETFIDVAFRVCKQGPLVASQIADVPAGFDAWFARATALGREQRFDSALEQADALGRVCEAAAGSNATGALRAAPALTPPVISGAATTTGEGVAGERGRPLRQIPRPHWLAWVGSACVAALFVAWRVLSANLPEPASQELGNEAPRAQPASPAPAAPAVGSEPLPVHDPAVAAEPAGAGNPEPKVRLIEAAPPKAAAASEQAAAPTNNGGADSSRAPSAPGRSSAPERRSETRALKPAAGTAGGTGERPREAERTVARTTASPPAVAQEIEFAEMDKAPVVRPEAPGSAPLTFNREAARAALHQAARDAQNCKPQGGPTGTGRVEVRYEPSGRVAAVKMLTAKFEDTATGSCVVMVFRRAKVPEFTGVPAVVVNKTFEIP